jgi:hypothetical protein
MSERGKFKNGKIYLPVFSFTDGCGEAFFQTLGLDPNNIGTIPLGEHTIELELFRIGEHVHEGLDLILNKADASLLLVRFLDQISMNRIKEAYRLVGAEAFLPKTIAVFREPKEGEFKISCTYCGQKLWVRDRDAGRRGNCPKCRKTFFIPTQKAFITSFLMLTETVPVISVTNGDSSCRNAVTSLVERIVSMDEGMKSSTIRIEFPPE